MSKTLGYGASLVPEIADDIVAIDAAMRDGYNWKYGPFELLDQIGVAWFVDRLHAENRACTALLADKRHRLYKVKFRQTSVCRFIRQLSARSQN